MNGVSKERIRNKRAKVAIRTDDVVDGGRETGVAELGLGGELAHANDLQEALFEAHGGVGRPAVEVVQVAQVVGKAQRRVHRVLRRARQHLRDGRSNFSAHWLCK